MHTNKLRQAVPVQISPPGSRGPGGPFNVDLVVPGLKSPPEAVRAKNAVYVHFAKSYPEAIRIADRALTPLFQMRARLLAESRRPEEPWATALRREVEGTMGKPPRETVFLAQRAKAMADKGQPEAALALLNDGIREILNTRSVGLGWIPGRVRQMWQGFTGVLELDPNFPKAKYNWASKLAKYRADDPKSCETATRLIKEAILGAQAYGLRGQDMLEQARTKDRDWVQLRGDVPKNHKLLTRPETRAAFARALDEAEAALRKQAT